MTNCVRLLAVTATLTLLAAPSPAQQEYEFKAGRWVPTTAPAKGTAEGEAALIRRCVDRGHYRAAVSAAKRFVKHYDDPASREEVMMLAGEAELKRGRLFQGYEWFEKQLAEFPDGRYSDRALDHEFDVAEAFLAGKKRIVLGFLRLPARDEGLDILSRIADHVPGTARAERALMRIADDRYARGEWEESAEAYDRYLAAFAKGSKAGEAMLRGAHATHRSFTGIAHDETPLIEAEQRYRQFAQQYPISAKEADVEATLEHIRATRAAKLLEEGRFYQRIDKPQAAAFTYHYLIESYPQTDAASRAQSALERLAPKRPTRSDQAAPSAKPPASPAPAPKEDRP